ncbi:helix-turn-helix domain-containing protein [Streptosporangium amethystogenes]|uniref:helix-turn-helix domain-containing protein n=1 Tax=Streptosporangium amethystogenes TaxID=2002 RepID=UPI001FE237B3|nr:helix-turn-helix domain-containing protein [Streptosporangium amethystogenes]
MPADATKPVVILPELWQRPEMLTALQKRNIGQVFQLIRQYAGVSQTRIGTAVNLSQGKISEIMRGTVKVTSFEVFERVADGLDMPDSARLTLGLAPRRLPTASPQPQRTPPPDEAVPPSDTDLLTPYLASLTGASSRPVISGLRHVLTGHIQAEAIMGPLLLINAVQGQVPVVGQVCRVTRGADRTEALNFASELLEFCGWLHQDLGDFTRATMWTNKALDYAMELGDQRVISYILMRKSIIATEAGDYGHGLGMANAALANPDALTPRLRAVILRTRATANAYLREAADSARDSETALVEATAGMTQSETDRAPYCTPAYIAMETGATRVLLGEATAAIPIFEASRSQWPESSQTRDHVLFLTRMATAYAIAGEREQACTVTEDALSRMQALRSSRVAGQLTALRAHLARWSADPYMADLLTRVDILSESFSLPASQPQGDR